MENQKQLAQRNLTVQQFERTLVSNSRRFKWRSQDTWSKFLDAKFNYLKMNSDLLHQDSQWLQSLREHVVSSSSPSVLSVNHSTVIDGSSNKSSQNEQACKMIQDHVRAIVKKPGHAIHSLLAEFTNVFMQNYDLTMIRNQLSSNSSSSSSSSSSMMMSMMISTSDNDNNGNGGGGSGDGGDEEAYVIKVKECIAKAVTDIDTFVEKLVQALFGKYWIDTMNDVCERVPECERIVVSCIQSQLMTETGIYVKMLNLYHVVHQESDDRLNEKIQKLNRNQLLLKHFHVKIKFVLGQDVNRSLEPYQTAIDQFIQFDVESNVPLAKLQCLTDCIREITSCVTRYYRENVSLQMNATNLELGADDLLPLFSYVLAKARPSCLFSKLNFLADFVDESHLLGELGYSLATLETAINYMLTCEMPLPDPPMKPLPPTPSDDESLDQRTYYSSIYSMDLTSSDFDPGSLNDDDLADLMSGYKFDSGSK